MRWTDLLRSAAFGLRQHKLRTLLTLCGVTLGALLLFVSISGGIGVIHTVNERLGIGDRLLEVNVSSGFLVDEVSAEAARDAGFTQEMSDERRIRLATASGVGGRKSVPMDQAGLAELQKMKHVAGAWPKIHFNAAVHFLDHDQWATASVKAIQPTKVPSVFLVAGRPFSGGAAKEVMVGELYLYLMGVQSDEEVKQIVGTKIMFVPNSPELAAKAKQLLALTIVQPPGVDRAAEEATLRAEIQKIVAAADYQSEPLEIVGVVRTLDREEARYHPELAQLDRNLVVSQEAASEIWKAIAPPKQRLQVTVRADRPENVLRLENELSDRGYRTVSMAKLALQIRSAVMLITLIIVAIAAAALMISGIGITNTMIMNVLERRREIAIMKAIGAQDRDIQRVFLLEGMLIGITGGILGLVLGRFLSGLTSQYIQQLLEWRLKIPFGNEIFAFPWWLILFTPLIAAIVTTLASMLPARQAARVDPVATLRSL